MVENIVRKLQFPGSEDQYIINAAQLDGHTWTQIEERFAAFEALDALTYKGTIEGADATPGTQTPTADCGDVYKVSKAGYIGGAKVEVGDMLICNADKTEAGAIANWNIIQGNVDVAAILDHTHNATAEIAHTSESLPHDIGYTKETITGSFANGVVSVDGTHGHSAGGSVTITTGGSVVDKVLTPKGDVTLTAPATKGDKDVTVTPAGTVAESTESFVTGVTVDAHEAHTHGGTTGAASDASVKGTITISAYTPSGSLDSQTTVTAVEAKEVAAMNHSVSEETAGGFTPEGSVSIDPITPEGSVASHKHDVSASLVAGDTTTKRFVTSVTHGYDYDGKTQTLTISFGSTADNISVPSYTGVTISEQDKSPVFTGTQITPAATFTGTPVAGHKHNVSVDTHAAFTPELNVTSEGHSHVFTGDAATITASHSLTAAHTHDFTTEENTVGMTHSVNAPVAAHAHGFTGTPINLHAEFKGTEETHSHEFSGGSQTCAVAVTVNDYVGNFSGTATGDVNLANAVDVVKAVTIAEHTYDKATGVSVTTGTGVQE